MNDLTQVRAAVYLARSFGKNPTLRLVDRLVCTANDGRAYRKQRLADMIRQVLNENGNPRELSGTVASEKSLVAEPNGNRAEPMGTPKENKTETVEQLSMVSNETTEQPKPKKRRRERVAAEKPQKPTKLPPEWVEPLREATRSLHPRLLRSLTGDERMTLGRYHALRFGFCRAVEPNNRSKAGPVASQIAGMATSPQFHDYTVAQFIALCWEYHKSIGERPWFTPWDAKAVAPSEDLERRRIER